MPTTDDAHSALFHDLPNSVVPVQKEGYRVRRTPCGYALQNANGKNELVLNNTGLLIWGLCTREHSLGAIVSMLHDVFPDQGDRIPADVSRVLDTFREYEVIDILED